MQVANPGLLQAIGGQAAQQMRTVAGPSIAGAQLG